MLQCFLVAGEYLVGELSGLVAACLSLLVDFLNACLYGLKVLELKFGVDDRLVTKGIYGAVDVGDVVIVEATQYVQDGIRLTDVG